jgi:threonine dehydratase
MSKNEDLDFIKSVTMSPVYDVAKVSSMQELFGYSNKNVKIYLKREDKQSVKSFKLRGAYHKIKSLTENQLKNGVIAASAGNHAQGVALSAKNLSIKSLIVMPKTTPDIKVNAVINHGSEVLLHGDNYSEAADYCKQINQELKMEFIHPFDDELVVAGQATIGKEILEQLPEVTHVFVPIGGGGLISGVSKFIKLINPKVKIIGVEPEDSSAMKQSILANKIIELEHVGIFADGVAVKRVGNLTFEYTKKYVDEIITVSTDEICFAIQQIFESTRTVVEPSGALAMAAVNRYIFDQTSYAVAICSGANINFERLQFIAERTLLGSGKESLYSVVLKEEPGALFEFCNKIINGYNINEFGYRLKDRTKAHIFIGVKSVSNDDSYKFVKSLEEHSYKYENLSDDDITKQHVRYMIGGTPKVQVNEKIYLIEFPERPGALYEFLSKISTKFNISLFHYRSLGGDIGKVMIGFEYDNISELENDIKNTGFDFEEARSKSITDFL